MAWAFALTTMRTPLRGDTRAQRNVRRKHVHFFGRRKIADMVSAAFASGPAETNSQPSLAAMLISFWKSRRNGVIQRYSHAVVCEMDAQPVERKRAATTASANLCVTPQSLPGCPVCLSWFCKLSPSRVMARFLNCGPGAMGSARARCERLLCRHRNVEPLAISDCHPSRLLPPIEGETGVCARRGAMFGRRNSG